MGYSTITQIGFVIISIVIVFTYIKPTFAEIGQLQEDTYEFNDAIVKAEQFNQRLRELIAIENSFSMSDRVALETFLPENINKAQVLRDIEYIAEQDDITIDTISIADSEGNSSDDDYSPTVTDEDSSQSISPFVKTEIDLDVTVTYEELKQFLTRLEANSYVLEVTSMTFGLSTEDGSGNQANQENSNESTVSNDGSFPVTFTLSVYQLNTAIATQMQSNTQSDDMLDGI